MKSASPTERPLTRANHRAAIRAHRRRVAISAVASAVVCGQRSPNCTPTNSNCRPKTSNRFHHRNQQYSIIALTDGTGAIEERYAYSAYGEPVFTNASGTVLADSAKDNRYSYTGREWDEKLSLYHFRARMYDAESGRFCGRDPLVAWLVQEFLMRQNDRRVAAWIHRYPTQLLQRMIGSINQQTLQILKARDPLEPFHDDTWLINKFINEEIIVATILDTYGYVNQRPVCREDPLGFAALCGACTGIRIPPIGPAPRGMLVVTLGVGTCTGGSLGGWRRCICLQCNRFDVWRSNGFWPAVGPWWTNVGSTDTCL